VRSPGAEAWHPLPLHDGSSCARWSASNGMVFASRFGGVGLGLWHEVQRLSACLRWLASNGMVFASRLGGVGLELWHSVQMVPAG
jgi:hypothetical protein